MRFNLLLLVILWLCLCSAPQTVAAQGNDPQGNTPQENPSQENPSQENISQSTPAVEITYTVISGDSLYAIAARFGTTVDAISAANNLVDPSLLRVGQLLIIPDATFVPPAPEAAVLSIPTTIIRALPGDNPALIAKRYAQPLELISAINQFTNTTRLFPGQPVAIPSENIPPDPLHFGSVTALSFPDTILQGHTGRLLVTTSRPLTLSASLAELSLPLQSFSTDALRHFAYLPVSALWEPALHPLTLTYVTASGIAVSRTWQINVADAGFFSQQIIVPPERSNLLAPEVVQGEVQKLQLLWSPVTPQLYWTSVFSRPINSVYQTTSPFGTRRNYNDGLLVGIHSGQDFGAPEGIPVVAPGNGVVVLAEPLQVRGNAVVIDHGGGVYSGYWHLSQINVAVGQNVNQGDLLGLVGNTGLSTGAHLHWELHIYGVAVDPTQFLDEGLLQ